MLCISDFMNDVTFGRNGPYGDAGRLNLQNTTTNSVAMMGRSLMSMNALFQNAMR